MESKRQKNNRICFTGSWIAQIICLAAVTMICLTLSYIYTHPIPKETVLKATSVRQLLSRDAGSSALAVMNTDVSAMELTVHDNGHTETVYLSSGTVADALEMAGITLGEFDELSVDDDTEIHSGMDIYITRVTVEESYSYEPIPFETVMQASSSLLKGSEIVVQHGEDGVRQYTYDMIYKNGVMTDKILASTSVYEKPVNKVIAYGTATWISPSSTLTVSTTSQILTLEDGTQIPYTSYLDVNATAYTTEGKSFNITKSGAVARYGIIAVDPTVIPMGTRMYIASEDGDWTYGFAIAGDTGGFIKGNRIDLFYNTNAECIHFGRRNVRVYLLEPEA